MKEEFVSTVSHELRTPLTSIRGSIGLLTGGLAGEFSDKAKQLLGIAQNNTERLLLLINDILDLSKIEAGKMDFHFKEVDLQTLLDHAIDAIEGYAKEHNIEFVVENSVKGGMIQADEGRLMQVLNNLMSNAAKFAPTGDKVRVSAVRHHHQIRISVTDHGPGIPKELQPRIFDKFTQADSSDTRQVGGTGLGLNITKAIVEKHNGRIAFVTEIGVGTTFYFDIPEIKTHEVKTDKTSTAIDVNSQRVLICDDEADVAALIRLMLAQAGFEGDIALNAQEAEALLQKNHYSAMTLDIMLPDKDGVTLYKELRENPLTKQLPVVFVSVKADATKQEQGKEIQESAHWINKPIDEADLVEALKEAISENKINTHLHILHVEDDDDIRNLIGMLLDDHFIITESPTLKEAREYLNKEGSSPFDLVLLDIGLPDGSGLDLLKDISKIENPPEILVFSADDIQVGHIDNVTESLVKSKTTNEQLVDKIKSIIGKRVY
ncbi:MAG: response regulator [Pseudomonadota bacterium]|nr:response regulator [Pseudomonadota bacterium]